MKSSYFVVALCLATLNVMAESESPIIENTWTPTGTFQVSTLSKYIGLRISREIYGKPVFWTDTTVNLPHDFWFGFWTSTGMDDGDISSNFGDELNFTVGKVIKFDGLKTSVSTTWLQLYPLGKWWDGDMLSHCIKFSKSFGDLTTELRIDYLHTTDGKYGALIALPSVSYPIVLTDEVKLDTRFWITWDDGFKANNPGGIFARLDLALSFSCENDWSLQIPKVTILEPLTNTSGRGEEIALGIGATRKF